MLLLGADGLGQAQGKAWRHRPGGKQAEKRENPKRGEGAKNHSREGHEQEFSPGDESSTEHLLRERGIYSLPSQTLGVMLLLTVI